MGLPSVISYVRGLLDGIAMPFPSADLAAYITPPDPNVETTVIPTLYVLTAEGPEQRLTVPRNSGPGTPSGDKTIDHALSLHIIWIIAAGNPAAPGALDPDLLFGSVIETVMARLRTAPSPHVITDPFPPHAQTTLVDTGEKMTYRYLPRHAVRNQRMLRRDGLIDLPLKEVIGA
ncbi:MAG TPA: hypothetical protein VKU77_01290 [Streptosporangiaceae bacterium]|nr:hypothetical protein [Streptosporangiaceae bacterium]